MKGKLYRARHCRRHLPEVLQPYVVAKREFKGRKCGAHRRDGTTCGHRAGFGTDHVGFGKCKFHGGAHRSGRTAAAREEVVERTAQLVTMGLPLNVDPMEALLMCVRISAGEVAFASHMVAQLTEQQAVIQHRKKVVEDSEQGVKTTIEKSTDTRLHIWIKTRQDAMVNLSRFSKMALDAGVAERQVKIAETVGGLLGRMVRGILADLGLSTEQERRAPEIVRRHMTVLEGHVVQAEELTR